VLGVVVLLPDGLIYATLSFLSLAVVAVALLGVVVEVAFSFRGMMSTYSFF
jgi:hypothetical protein